MEQREHNAELKAMNLIQEFVKKFRSIDFTLHPSDIPGEAPGKGSNMAWAARKLSERYTMSQRKDVIITGIDGTCALNSRPWAFFSPASIPMHMRFLKQARFLKPARHVELM